MKKRWFLAAACLWLCSLGHPTPSFAQRVIAVNNVAWKETAVRKVLHTFAYGGFATDAQIAAWAQMPPEEAIQEMLNFEPANEELSRAQDNTSDYADSLEALQAFLSTENEDRQPAPPNGWLSI